MRRLLWIALLAALARGEETLSDDWSVVQLFGKEVGYVHTRTTRKGDIIETCLQMKIVIKRAGAELAAEQTDTTEELADGTLVRIQSKRKMSSAEQTSDVLFEAGKATVSVTVMGQTRKSTIDVPADLRGPHRIEELTREAKPGEKFEVRTFLADLGAPMTLVVTRGAAEEIEMLDGSKQKLDRVETNLTTLSMKVTTWLDADGKARRTSMPLGGMQMETWLVTEERARRSLGGGATAPEIFTPTLLAARPPIPRPRQLDRAIYRVRAKNDMPDLADDRQTVELTGEKTALLTIERKVPPLGRTGQRPLKDPPAEVAESLAPNSMIQSDSPDIVATAREVVGDEPDAWKAAQKLERWVKENVKSKNLDVGFASAAEVMRDRQGDCTEHSVLLCALCRAAGIPARCAMGIVCMGSVWGGHAWNEVWIDGRWYGLDATLGQGSVDPAHITLARVTLKDAGFAAEFAGLVQGLGNLEIEATEVVLEGRTIRLGEERKVEGDRFEDLIYGIRFACPKGCTLGPPGAPKGIMTPLAEIRGKGVIRVSVVDASTESWDGIKQALSGTEETKVGDRPALRVGPNVYVLGTKGLFLFEPDGADTAIEELLSSAEFDAK